jgi:hypothetical protein
VSVTVRRAPDRREKIMSTRRPATLYLVAASVAPTLGCGAGETSRQTTVDAPPIEASTSSTAPRNRLEASSTFVLHRAGEATPDISVEFLERSLREDDPSNHAITRLILEHGGYGGFSDILSSPSPDVTRAALERHGFNYFRQVEEQASEKPDGQ